MEYLWFILGVITGIIVVGIISYLRKTHGVLRIDHSDPEKDLYRFDIGDLDSLSKKKRLVLKIDNQADLSQK